MCNTTYPWEVTRNCISAVYLLDGAVTFLSKRDVDYLQAFDSDRYAQVYYLSDVLYGNTPALTHIKGMVETWGGDFTFDQAALKAMLRSNAQGDIEWFQKNHRSYPYANNQGDMVMTFC